MEISEKTKQRFLSKVDMRGRDECWEWTDYKNRDGYGNFWYDGTIINSHRFMYLVCVGEIPHGMCVCHSCDNPACANPSHLFLGTRRDNMLDMSKKGRARSHILTKEQIEFIRNSDKTPKEIGEILGVGGRHVARIKRDS